MGFECQGLRVHAKTAQCSQCRKHRGAAASGTAAYLGKSLGFYLVDPTGKPVGSLPEKGCRPFRKAACFSTTIDKTWRV